jgi:hypothetical protein
MTVQIQPNNTSVLRVYPGSKINIVYTPPKTPAGETSATDAYVYDVDPTAAEKSKEAAPDSPLSEIEKEQLFDVYLELGNDNPLWGDIDTLLTEELTGNDRTNFLAVLSETDELLMEDFLGQVDKLKGDTRSLYLSTALRNGSGGVENLIDVTDSLLGNQLTNFLTTTDSLGRSVESVKAGELQNFIAAVAESPEALDSLNEKTSVLDEEDRALFLEAAANAGDELERFINTTDLLTGTNLTRFLENAATAGEGLTNLLTLSGKLTGDTRSDFLKFTNRLEDGNAENFLLATQGDVRNLTGLMATTRSLHGNDRANFLALAADAGASLDRLISMTDSLAGEHAQLSDFLSTAIKAEEAFGDFLGIAEKLGGKDRANILSFASTLGFTDLTNFLSAAKDNTSQAAALADTASDLKRKDKSYLLYAASLNPDYSTELTTMTRSLKGQEQSDFLFTAANIPPGDAADEESPDAMAEFIRTADELKGTEKEEFLARERMISTVDRRKNPAKEYVYLNSVFDEDELDAILSTGEHIDEVMANFDSMDAVQRDTFFSVSNKVDKEMLPELMSVMTRLDEERSNDFLAYARTLGKESISDLIVAADQTLGETGENTETYDRLMETAKSLDPAVDADFLHAAANAGKNLDKLMDLTNELEGFIQTEFLIIADHMADQGILGNYLKATKFLLEKGPANIMPENNNGEGVRPSDMIIDGEFQGRHRLEGYLESTRFLMGVGISNSHMNDWFNSWQGIPRQT